PAVFALGAGTSVRTSTFFDPTMRISFFKQMAAKSRTGEGRSRPRAGGGAGRVQRKPSVDMPGHWWPHVCHVRPDRPKPARTQELRRLCPLFAERAQEGGKQAGLGRTW